MLQKANLFWLLQKAKWEEERFARAQEEQRKRFFASSSLNAVYENRGEERDLPPEFSPPLTRHRIYVSI